MNEVLSFINQVLILAHEKLRFIHEVPRFINEVLILAHEKLKLRLIHEVPSLIYGEICPPHVNRC
jgi:hypothetical protein